MLNELEKIPLSECEEDSASEIGAPDTPYGPKIASITNEGIEFYWKKVEIASGYEIFRSYEEPTSEQDMTSFEKIAEINTRRKGEYIDSAFDPNKKRIYYKSRSYLETDGGKRIFSDFTKAAEAVFREEMKTEREVTYMYDGTSRHIKVLYGWGEVNDVQWTSSDEQVAMITQEGMIHAVATGEAVLFCKSPVYGETTTKVVVNRKSMEPLNTGNRRFTFNEETQHWENKNVEKCNDAVIMMVGDLMCGAAQTKRQYTEENDWCYNDSFMFVRKTTALSDFAVGNLETLMAPGYPYMIDEAYIDNKNNCNNPSRYLDAVLYGGFDAVTMSNNHNCDGGTRALLETIEATKMRNIPYTGIFRDSEDKRFMIVNVNGIKVGFLAYMSKHTGFNGKDATWSQEEKDTLLNVFSKERVQKDVSDCKAAGAEYVIAYMHWGEKNYKSITKAQEKEAKEVADAGVDYIVGANPHVVQIYDDIKTEDNRIVPCFYSTGNFQAYMNQIPGNRDSVMVRIRLRKDETGQVVLTENNYIPYHTYNEKYGCNWPPIATSQAFDKALKVPGKNKYYKQIIESIGNKVQPL